MRGVTSNMNEQDIADVALFQRVARGQGIARRILVQQRLQIRIAGLGGLRLGPGHSTLTLGETSTGAPLGGWKGDLLGPLELDRQSALIHRELGDRVSGRGRDRIGFIVQILKREMRPCGAVVGGDAQVKLQRGVAQVDGHGVHAIERAAIDVGHQTPGRVAWRQAPGGQVPHLHLHDLVGFELPPEFDHARRRRVVRHRLGLRAGQRRKA